MSLRSDLAVHPFFPCWNKSAGRDCSSKPNCRQFSIGVYFLQIICILSLAIWTGNSAGAEPTVEDILRTWRLRQDEIRTATVRWNSKMFHRKGSVTPAPFSPTKKALPEKDLWYVDPSCAIWISGNRIRYEHEQVSLKARTEGGTVNRYLSAFNGTTSSELTTPGTNHEFGIGIIATEREYGDIGNIFIWPLLFWCRPLHPKLPSSSDLRITKEFADINGQKCVKIFSTANSGRRTSEFWIDINRGFQIVKYTALEDNRPVGQVTIEYTDQTQATAVPNWTAAFLILA
jgi:hypothetical protein